MPKPSKIRIPQAYIRFSSRTDVVLTKDLNIYFDNLKFTIKKGYKTDGASIPHFLWSIAGSPFQGDTLTPAIFHDICYESEYYSRAVADNNFLFLMRSNDVRWLKRTTYYLMVRIFGLLAQSRHTVGSVETARQYLLIKRTVI